MKLRHLLPTALIAMSAALLGSASAQSTMVSSNDRVRVEVRAENKNDKQDIANSTASATTQHKKLTILVSGKVKNPETRTVQWKVYGRDVASNTTKVLESGNENLALDDRGTQTITSKEVVSKFTPDHTVTDRNNNNNNPNDRNRQIRSNRVKGNGTKIVGYSVKVMDGSNVVGEAADPFGIDKAK